MPDDWNPLDPMKSVKQDKSTGRFTTLQKIVNPVPENILPVTASFLRFAYGVKIKRKRLGVGWVKGLSF